MWTDILVKRDSQYIQADTLQETTELYLKVTPAWQHLPRLNDIFEIRNDKTLP